MSWHNYEDRELRRVMFFSEVSEGLSMSENMFPVLAAEFEMTVDEFRFEYFARGGQILQW